MNGVSALALATMNDTRAVEAAAHASAARSGCYRGLSQWEMGAGVLRGRIEMALPMASAGGSVDFHPAARACLRILGFPDGPGVARIAAALGLAQNFAALFALVTEGIQRGHLRKHAARLAWNCGARGRRSGRSPPPVERRGPRRGGGAGASPAAEGRGPVKEEVICRAGPSLALIKYWGKEVKGDNLPATPSLAITLGGVHRKPGPPPCPGCRHPPRRRTS